MKGMSNMFSVYQTYPCSYYVNAQKYGSNDMYNVYGTFRCPYFANMPMYNTDFSKQFVNQDIPFTDNEENSTVKFKDHGPEPFAVNIEEAARRNRTFRTTLWTGNHLQLTLMSIKPGEDIGLEMHPDLDQFIRIEDGQGLVKMGNNKHNLYFRRRVYKGYIIIIPAGKWHNLVNTGDKPIKLYSIYAPPQHPYGTVHETKADAQAAEKGHS